MPRREGRSWHHLLPALTRSGPSASPAVEIPVPPSGDGPLIWLRVGLRCDHVSADEPALGPPLIQLLAQLRRRSMRILVSRAGGPVPEIATRGVTAFADPPAGAVQGVLAALRPDAVLLVGPDLPERLVTAAEALAVPVVLAEARLAMPRGGWAGVVRSIGRPGAATRLTRLLMPDPVSARAAEALGADPQRIEVTGPITVTRDPPRHVGAERVALAEALRGRQLWLAACLTAEECAAVAEAHLAVLSHSHRAVLVVMACDPALVPVLSDILAGAGLVVARRCLDEDPTEEVSIYLADDPQELGLWYRLAPVTFMGTTLAGPTDCARHPFEAAALGSALVHGPQTRPFASEWAQLDGAGATIAVTDAASLSRAVVSLLAPDQSATLAARAWEVSTGGAGVASRVAAAVAEVIAGDETAS